MPAVIVIQTNLIAIQIIMKLKLMKTSHFRNQSISAETKQLIVICPNCQYYFKVAQIQHAQIISNKKTISDKDISQTYDKLPLQNSRESQESIVNQKAISKQQTHQQVLISALINSQMDSIQKLKTLNDINELKKSKLKTSKNVAATFQEVNYTHSQKTPISKPLKTAEQSPIKKLNSPPPKETYQPNAISQVQKKVDKVDSQSLIEQGLQKQMAVATLGYLIQWIQSFGLRLNLPSFIKSMVEQYSSLQKSNLLLSFDTMNQK